jgi:hypothetical protein
MAIGDKGDFRTVGFQQVPRFDGQDHFGGGASPMLYETAHPLGGSNVSPPVSPGTTIALGNNNFTFPGVTLPNIPPPVIYLGGGAGTTTATPLTVTGPGGTPSYSPVETIEFDGTAFASLVLTGTTATVSYDGGGAAPGTITVSKIDSPASSYSGISTIQFTGVPAVTVTNPSAGVALVTLKSTILYGQITGAVKQTYAQWLYTVTIYTAGVAGASVSAWNLLELDNDNTSAYGYAVTATGGYTLISGTNYYVKLVPVGTWVRMEYVNHVTGTNAYYFSAPNMIDGGC